MTKVIIWGCRGSLAAPGADFTRYGGNTSCVEIVGDNGTRLILDGGTGLLGLGRSLNGSGSSFNLLLTHLHMDHIQGMGFFPPFFNPDAEVHIWGPASTTLTLRERLSRYLSPPLFPVTLRDLPCKLELHEVPCGSFVIGEFTITSDLIGHVGPTVGYRIQTNDGVVTYIPDHEPALGIDIFPLVEEWTSGFDLAAGADILIHDAQYCADEYTDCIGWGHSSITDTFKFATLAAVKQLVTFHYAPTHKDDFIDQMIVDTIESHKPSYKVTPAKEGAVFTL